MKADNPLRKKVGPLEVWQYVAIGTSAGFMYWLYKKKKSETSEVNPEEEEKLLGALDKGAGGGGGEGTAGSVNPTTAPAAEGPKGEAGPAGPAGSPGPQGEAPSAGLEAQVNALEEDLVKNQPPTQTHNGAAQALPKGYVKNSKGEAYRTVVKGNGIFHEYLKRTGASKILKVGTVHKPAKPAKRVTKPKPVAHKIAVQKAPAKHAAAKAKKKQPVHHK